MTHEDELSQDEANPVLAESSPSGFESTHRHRRSRVSTLRKRGWCFCEISEVPIPGTITEEDLDAIPRQSHQDYFDQYFLSPVSIFPTPKHSEPNGWFARTLLPGFAKDHLWPGYLEERIKALIVSRLGRVDRGIRALIDELIAVYYHNLKYFIVWKRTIQFASIALVQIATLLLLIRTPADTSLLLIGSMVGVCALATILSIVLFWGASLALFNSYYNALRQSSQEASSKTKDRINSIYRVFGKYEERILKLQERGEPIEENIEKKFLDDSNKAKFWTEMRLWLAARVEGLQLWLICDMQISQRRDFFLNVVGFISAYGIWIISMIVPLAFLIDAGIHFTPHAQATEKPEQIPILAEAVLSVIMVAQATVVSWASYYYEKWNYGSGKGALQRYFVMDEWMTIDKFKLHEAIGQRVQTAMDRIHQVNEQLGAKQRP
jgi:hypothetical protein